MLSEDKRQNASTGRGGAAARANPSADRGRRGRGQGSPSGSQRHCNAPRTRLRGLSKPTTMSKLRWRDWHFCGTHPQGLNWRPWLNSFLVPKKKTTTARPHNCCGRSATRSCGRCSRRKSSWSVAPRLALSSKNDDESSTYSCSRRRNPRGSRPHLYCGTRPARYGRSANLSWGHSVRRNARKLPVSRR